MHQLVIHTPQPNLLSIRNLNSIINAGPGIFKEILSDTFFNNIRRCLFNSNRVSGGNDTNIWNIGFKGLVHTITMPCNMCQEIEVDDLPCLSLRNSQTVLRYFFLKVDRAFIPGDFYGVKPADGQAFPAANTYLGINDGKLLTHLNSAHRTPSAAHTAGITPFLLDLRNNARMLRQFPAARGEIGRAFWRY